MGRKRKVTKPGVSFARARLKQIHGGKRERRKAFNALTEGLDFPKLCDASDYLVRNVALPKRGLLFGTPLPQTYDELGDVKESPFITENVLGELNHCLIGIREHKDEISLFLKYKKIYEGHLVIGNLHEAEQILNRIEKEVCYSVWTLENRFLLKELLGKPAQNKELLSDFNETNQGRSITKHVAHYLSQRAERSLSVNRYFNDLELALTSLDSSPVKEEFQNYYRFKLTFLSHLNFTDYAAILSIEFGHSIVDRYLNMVRVLTSLLAVSTYLEDNNPKKIVLKSYLKNRLNYLLRKVDDPLLFRLKLFSGEDIFSAFHVGENNDLIKTIDLYTRGEYSKIENKLKELLLKSPNQFDLYPMYVKTLIYQRKKFSIVGKSGSLQNEILSDVYKIIAVNTNTDQIAHNLLRIANNLSSCVLSYGIVDFVFHQTEGKSERKLLSRLAYNPANPIIHEVYGTKDGKSEYLSMLLSRFPDSLTAKFFADRLIGSEELKKYEAILPKEKYLEALAHKLQEESDFLGASKHWEYLVKNNRDTNPILEIAIVNLFRCYLKLNKPNDCIDLYVDSYFFNNYIVHKIDVSELLENIRKNRFKNVEKCLNLPIFYTIVDTDEVESHIAFELFNRASNVEKPSDLLSVADDFDKEKFLFFLEFSCSPKILMHSTYIETSKDRLEERLTIANFVKSQAEDTTAVLAEIKSIENILVIQQGLIDLDESKIYVNEQGILENELQEFEAIYERFEIIAGITGKKTLLWLEGGKLTTYSSKENTELEKVEYSNNPVYDIYLELFNAIKQKFLNSQFGIVAYLSTRIRHGVLVGELRPIFETHNLITLKEGNSSNYRRNVHWDLVYQRLGQEKLEQIQVYLKEFSGKVDGIIFDLIKKHLQVYKPEVNEEGWFNYQFGRSDLWYHSISSVGCTSFEDFVNDAFVVLWKRTDQNLAMIRTKIESETLAQFNKCFDDLEINITGMLGSGQGDPLLKAVKDCSTEVHTVTKKISRWFKRSEMKAADFNLAELIDIVHEYTNKSSWYKRLRLKKSLAFDCSIAGDYKVHFADLIRIFLENILKHSSTDVIEIGCEILTSQEEGLLIIEVKNEITDESSIDLLRNIWKEGELDLVKLLGERKSGYQKAFKILTSDLKCDSKTCLSTRISDDNKTFSVRLAIDLNNVIK